VLGMAKAGVSVSTKVEDTAEEARISASCISEDTVASGMAATVGW
jgi:hypothetical protein